MSVHFLQQCSDRSDCNSWQHLRALRGGLKGDGQATSTTNSPEAGCSTPTHHIHGAEDVAVVVAGLQVLGDVGERAEIIGVLSSAGNVPDLVLSNDVL